MDGLDPLEALHSHSILGMIQMHLTVSETQLLSELLLMRGEIVLGLFRLSSLILSVCSFC